MTVARVRRDADVFLVTCDHRGCPANVHVRAGDAFQLARIAGRHGWAIGMRETRCKQHPVQEAKGKARKRA